MPLSSARATALTERLNTAFGAIGHAKATAMPPSRNRREPAAWEYHVASHLLRIAETRRKRAHAAAVKAGVLIDHEAEPEPEGTNRVVYQGTVVEVVLTVAAPMEIVNVPALVTDLLKAGVAPRVMKRLLAKNSSFARPAHKFTSGLVTG